jgi:minor extracellular serine protease Vpr
MPKKLIKAMLLTLTIVFSSIFIYCSQAQAANLKLAELYGNFDLESSELTSIIIELEDKSIVEAKHTGSFQNEKLLEVKRNYIIDEVTEYGECFTIIQEYDYLFSGFAVELPANEITDILSIPGIKAVYPNVNYYVPEFTTLLEEFEPMMTSSNPFIGTPEAWSMGYTGEGMIVAVIDSGVDYTHPELQHAFGEYKGYDFFDMDSDPMDGGYHGTHVTGTIVAESFGIAPDAQILAYRVLGPNGGTSAQVIAGIEQAVIDGADVMNLSLGNDLNDPDYATSIALDWAMAEGVVAVTSSGNSGPYDWSVGSPGASREAISVGSTALPYINVDFNTSDIVPYPSAKVMGYNNYEDLFALSGNTYEYEFIGLGYPEDYEGLDMEGKIALIIRGDLTFVDKVQIAKDHGAVAAIIFNNAAGEINTSGEFSLPTFQLDYTDGYNMYVVSVLYSNLIEINLYEFGEMISDFSSRGPAYGTWMIKPDVVAPGDWILSTYPGGYYAYAGGTSMASPHVAAASALILQAHPEYTPDDVKNVLMNTAEKITDPLTGEDYPHNVQGAGSIRIAEAIKAKTIVTPGSYSFGVFDKTKGKQVEGKHFEIKNFSNERRKYSFDVQFNGNPDGIKVTHSNNTNIKAHSSHSIRVNVQVDTRKLAPGQYEGTITVSDKNETIVVPIIIFVHEPNYPRVSFAGVQNNYDGTYLAYGYLLNGAEYVEIAFFNFNEFDGTIGEYLDSPFYAYDVPAGYYIEEWDGTIQGEKLPPGLYVIAVYAEYKGLSTTTATLFEIV